jgi:hypothetical protein
VQTDWHPGQLIFSSEEPGTADVDEATVNLVCIDFAFALQWPCLCHTPVIHDWADLRRTLHMVGIEDAEALREHWTPRDELEW